MKKEAIKYFLKFLNQAVEFITPAQGHVTEEQLSEIHRLIDNLEQAFPRPRTNLFKEKRASSLRSYHAAGGGTIIGGEITEGDVG